jgi:hypothetical protein
MRGNKMPFTLAEKEQLLQHEAFIKEILALRDGKTGGGSAKPAWQRFLETTGGAALITVLIGGIMGSVITGLIQLGAKNREAQQARLTARYNQGQVAYKEYLDKELEIVNRAFDLVGGCISASEDLVAMTTSSDYDPEQYQDQYKKNLEKQQMDSLNKYNEMDQKWRGEQHKLGLLMSYYHHGKPEVGTAWQAVQDAVNAQFKCTYDLYTTKLADKTIDEYKMCEGEKKRVLDGLSQLTRSLELARSHLWDDMVADGR